MQLEEFMKQHHDAVDLPMRFGYAYGQRNPPWVKQSGGCYYGASTPCSGDVKDFYGIFPGDGPVIPFDGLVSQEKRNEYILNASHGVHEYVGTERSLVWVDFLLSDKSPWKKLLPFIRNKDRDFINNCGWIFGDSGKLPSRLAYNFLLAQRFPWDNAPQFSLWLMLSTRVDATTALYIAMNFYLLEGAADLNGPYGIMYPWGPLEGAGLEAAGSFIRGKPKDLSHGTTHPNVVPLWSARKHDRECEALANELDARTDLKLPEIVSIIDDLVKKQV